MMSVEKVSCLASFIIVVEVNVRKSGCFVVDELDEYLAKPTKFSDQFIANRAIGIFVANVAHAQNLEADIGIARVMSSGWRIIFMMIRKHMITRTHSR